MARAAMRALVGRQSCATTRRAVSVAANTPALSAAFHTRTDELSLGFGNFNQPQRFVQQQRRQFSTQLDFVDVDQAAVDFSERELVAEPRFVDGTRHCRKLREQFLIPGIVYGVDANGKDRRLLFQLPWRQLQRELNNLGRAIENTIYTIRVGDETFRAVARDLQRHPTKEMPNSINFLCHDPNRKLRLQIPLEFYNAERCTGLRQGGAFSLLVFVSLRCGARTCAYVGMRVYLWASG